MKITKEKPSFRSITILLESEHDYLLLLQVLNFYIDYIYPDDKVDVGYNNLCEFNKICKLRNKLKGVFLS